MWVVIELEPEKVLAGPYLKSWYSMFFSYDRAAQISSFIGTLLI